MVLKGNAYTNSCCKVIHAQELSEDLNQLVQLLWLTFQLFKESYNGLVSMNHSYIAQYKQ